MLDRFGWIALLLAFIPAVIRLSRTRSLLRHTSDPALPERMAGIRNLIAFAVSSVLIVEMALWARHLWWSLPIMIVTFALAGWPLRRALFAETWSFGSYLWFYVRLVVVIYGFWLLLMWTPWLQNLDAMRGWAVAAGLGVVLLIWNDLYSVFLRFVMRTKQVATASLVDRFNAIIAKTTVTPPNVEYVDMQGGAFVNALAVPDTRRASVLFTSTLLERFDEDEVAAIFAHEVAHLEFYSPAYLKRWRVIGWLLILATVSIRPLVHSTAFEWIAIVWPVVVLLYMAVRGHKQKHETESDLRAVALTGDPEVMVRALVKLHEMMKLPRRMDPNTEAQASHPSLARRIQAIRSASGSPAAALTEPISFRHESTSVTLHADRLVWAEGEVTAYTFAYSGLDELRVDADAKGAMRLVASDPAGRKWTLQLDAEDVPRAQAALNLVDVQLRATPTARGGGVMLARWLAAMAAIIAVSATQLALVVVGALAAISAERPLLRAAAVAGLTAALLTALHGQAAFAWLLLLPAVGLAFMSYQDKRDTVSRTTWRLVALIGLLAFILLIPLGLAASSWLALHQAARTWPSAAIMAFAFAAANWPRRNVPWLAATIAAMLIGSTAIVLGTTQAADLLVRDPFYSRLEQTPALQMPTVADSRFEVGFVPSEIFLSPTARAIAAVTEDDYEEYVFHVGRPGQTLKALPADAALFVDDDRLLLLDNNRGNARVRLIHVDRPDAPLWATDIELSGSSISLGRDGQTWQLLGSTATGKYVRVTGAMDGAVSSRHAWPVAKSDGLGDAFPLVADEARLIVHKASYDSFGIGRGSVWGTWIDPMRSESRFVRIDPGGRREVVHSSLDVDCTQAPLIDEEPVCSGYDGNRSHLFRLSADGTLTPIAVLRGRPFVNVTRGWIIGWAQRPFAIDRASGRVYEVDSRRGFFAAGGEFVGVVATRENSASVELYRLSAR